MATNQNTPSQGSPVIETQGDPVTPVVDVTPTPEETPVVVEKTPPVVDTDAPAAEVVQDPDADPNNPVFNPATTARFVNRAPFAPAPLTEEEAEDKYTRLLNTYNFILQRHAFDNALVKMYNDMAGLNDPAA